ncbi:MAG: isoamylase early set domain-containing protein [Phycisphaerae bacterium]|nr:isoamylase early set domain-containing protein [Phycisphaerae bacterium]
MVTVHGQWAEFRFFRPAADRVELAGDFNDWREGQLPMSREDDGYWTARMRLPVGEFRFRYRADGQWFTDYAAFGVEPGRFGLDSIVRVPPASVPFAGAPARDADYAVA